MKHRLAEVAAAGAMCLALAVAGCAGGRAGGPSNESGRGAADGAPVSVAFVPKIQGIPFFEAMNTGGAEAAEEFGFNWVYSGPNTADPAAQSEVVRSLMQQRVDALLIAPNDPDSMAPLITEAQDQGIKVGTADTDAASSSREVFVTQATNEAIGTTLLEQMVEPIDGKGRVAIVSCGQTASNLNAWIEVFKDKAAADYPDMEIVDTVYADEDQAKAVTMAKNLINAHPDLKGLVGVCTTSAPGVAQAVQESGKTGEIATVGVGTPQAMLPYLKDGSASSAVLWDVEDLGYLTAWAGWRLAQGDTFEASQDVGRISGVTFDEESKTLILGEPLILTEENAGDYDY
ncbi:autoinducer 2 ABC transporter substrate-binding protein [Actinomyces sp.]|uniref:autoinducer 2 ABC transporter substrate-binding protein n=1 Tax=Actinomyces sp. TaxID=29317 RepID=UPI0026DD1B3F|nr:autoinducer 2 ABC transporter substrate-binding protein [Actinomyces sp.]MDO4901706.1 autoinducer 2 ABC transporter substrate-binding protein [Actinomyces sp.]